MAIQNQLIKNLLRIITPDEIAEIATKHNGGKYLSLTALVDERVDRNIHRDFTAVESMDQIHEDHVKYAEEESAKAKLLPFKSGEKAKAKKSLPQNSGEGHIEDEFQRLSTKAITTSQVSHDYEEEEEVLPEHVENENMSSFILIEKARLRISQKALKQKEIINLYQKNLSVDVEQIKNSNSNPTTSGEAGVLVNKKQF